MRFLKMSGMIVISLCALFFIGSYILRSISPEIYLEAKSYWFAALREWNEQEGNATPNDWFMEQRRYPAETFNPKAMNAILLNAQQSGPSTDAIRGDWKLVGPDNIGGRITDLQVHPMDAKRVYAGTSGGGVYISTDGGQTFQPTAGFPGSQSVGSIAVDPKNIDTIWVGTGEANSSGTTYPGTGVYVSRDAGKTWSHRGLMDSQHIGRIVVDPDSSSVLYVAALGTLYGKSESRGVYKSLDDGMTWTRILFIAGNTGAVDLTLNQSVMYVAFWEREHTPEKLIAGGINSSIYRSVDRGFSWEKVTKGLPSGVTTGRIGISASTSNNKVAYAIFDDTSKNFNGVYKTNDAGLTWSRTNDGSLSGMFATYGWWFGNIRVNPTNENQVIALGFTSRMSMDGGRSWQSFASSIHVDFHAAAFTAGSERIIVGNDGGIWVSNNNGASFPTHVKLANTQFYAVGVDSTNPNRVYGGAQDNGTIGTNDNGMSNWKPIYGGDGFQVVIDPVEPKVMYAESQNGDLGVSHNGGLSFSSASPNFKRANWNSPIRISPSDHKKVYFGADQLFVSNNQGSTWKAISPSIPLDTNANIENSSTASPRDTLTLGTITSIAVGPDQDQTIYYGTDQGTVSVTRDHGIHWTDVTGLLPKHWITAVVCDPSNAAHVYVSLSGYRNLNRLSHVYESRDYGATWTEKASGLPEVPVNNLMIDPKDGKTLIAATDVGVYLSYDEGASWKQVGRGLQNVPVMDVQVLASPHRIYAATFGRSIQSIDLD